MNPILLIFVKNSILGKVKTRLAKSVGDQAALEIYEQLITHTRRITQGFSLKKTIWYSDFIPTQDGWKTDHFDKKVQTDGELGQRMKQAFADAFHSGYQPVIIIGSDCLGLTTDILHTALQQLQNHDFVVGPATDGGYYLLGMNAFLPGLFEKKPWGTETVLSATLTDISQLHKTVCLLPELTDVDTLEDWEKCKHLLFETTQKMTD